MNPSPDLVARFHANLESLAGGAPAGLGLAVSGGPDSLALLLLASAAWPGRVAAATVDHGLRAKSESEAAFVSDICSKLGVPHAILEAKVDTDSASLQQSARNARYAALGLWLQETGIDFLATAHHADDQAETLMMRLLRGSGIAGLSGVRAKVPLPGSNSTATLLRPLLGWSRAELRAIVYAAGIDPVEDPSNSDPRFDRSRIRALLANAPWIEAEPLARSAAALAEAEEAIGWAETRLFEERVSRSGGLLSFDPEGIPAELRRRLLLRILSSLDPHASPPRGQEVARLLGELESGRTATLAGVKCIGGKSWRFEPAPPRRGGAKTSS